MPAVRYQWPEYCLRNSFFHLLLRDTVNNESPDLPCPLSIVLEGGYPRYIFEFDPDTADILLQTSGELLQAAALLERMLEAWADQNKRAQQQQRSVLDIAAVLIWVPAAASSSLAATSSSPTSPSSPGAATLDEYQIKSAPPSRVHIEPLTVPQLKDFLLNSRPSDPRRQHALLQSLPLVDEANFTVARVAWSPGQQQQQQQQSNQQQQTNQQQNQQQQSMCVIDRRQSKHVLADSRYSPAQRVVLFDARQEHSVAVRTSGATGAAIDEMCHRIAAHIARSTPHRVQEMMLYTVCVGGRQTLLWCSTLHLVEANEALLKGKDDESGKNKSGCNTVIPPSALESGSLDLAPRNTHEVALAKLAAHERALEREFRRGDPLGRTSTTTTSTTNNNKPKGKNATTSPTRAGNVVDANANTVGASSSPVTSPTKGHSVVLPPQSPTSSSSSSSASDLKKQVAALYETGWKSISPAIPEQLEQLRQIEMTVRSILSDALYSATPSKDGVVVFPGGPESVKRLAEALGMASLSDLCTHLGFVVPIKEQIEAGEVDRLVVKDLEVGVPSQHVLLSLLEVWLGSFYAVRADALRQTYAGEIRLRALRLALAVEK